MQYVEFRVIVEEQTRVRARCRGRDCARGDVQYGSLRRDTIAMLVRWISEEHLRERDDLEVLGTTLYEVLFSPTIDAAFRAEFENVRRDRNGYRLRLVL